MESSIAVEKNSFGPVGKYVFVWVVREDSSEEVGLRPVDTAAEVNLAPLVAGLKGLSNIWGPARSSSNEVHEDSAWISF